MRLAVIFALALFPSLAFAQQMTPEQQNASFLGSQLGLSLLQGSQLQKQLADEQKQVIDLQKQLEDAKKKPADK